jgi:hypothetical protein
MDVDYEGRGLAARCAIVDLCSAVNEAALAGPPFLPPIFPFATGFLILLGDFIFFLSRRYPHHLRGVPDDVGEALLAFRTSRHEMSPLVVPARR